jgi:hypothetical protein
MSQHQQYLQQFVHHTAQAAQCQAAQVAQAAHEGRAYFQGQHSLGPLNQGHPPQQHYSEPCQNQSVYPTHTTESYLTQNDVLGQNVPRSSEAPLPEIPSYAPVQV